MNNGAFGENFPYTNFHDLNLDWIIKEIKEQRKSVNDFEEELNALNIKVDEFQEYIDNIDDIIQDKIENELPQAIQEAITSGEFDDIISLSHKRRIVFIGDSYGEGWTPDGSFTSWPILVKNAMGLDNADFINSSAGGSGFGKSPSDGAQYVPTRIQYAYDNISSPDTITDIVIGMGYNDHLYYNDASRLQQGIQTAVAKCRQLFPNARVHIIALGFTTNHANQIKLRQTYRHYGQTTVDAQYYNISKALSSVRFFSSDGIHPLESGQYAIAISVLKILNNSAPYFIIPETMSSTEIKFQLSVGNDPQVFDSLVYGFSYDNALNLANTAFKIVTLSENHTFNLSGNVATKLAKITELGSQTGWYTPTPLKWTPCKFFCSVTGDTAFVTYDAEISIAEDEDNNDNDLYMWIRINGTSGGGFQNISNIYRFGIMGFNHKCTFITET